MIHRDKRVRWWDEMHTVNEKTEINLSKTNSIRFMTDTSKTGKLDLLVDTGATSSTVKKQSILENQITLQTDTLWSFSGDPVNSIGNVAAELHNKFLVVKSVDHLEVDGILGMHFLKGRAIIDLVEGKVQLITGHSEESINQQRCSINTALNAMKAEKDNGDIGENEETAKVSKNQNSNLDVTVKTILGEY